jgi:excisionase family DNA binding protein
MVSTGSVAGARRQFLTRADVARLFEVSPATVARWSRDGKLSFVRTPGGQRRYLRDRIIEQLGAGGGTG